MAMTGDTIDAATAENWRLVSRDVPQAELMAERSSASDTQLSATVGAAAEAETRIRGAALYLS